PERKVLMDLLHARQYNSADCRMFSGRIASAAGSHVSRAAGRSARTYCKARTVWTLARLGGAARWRNGCPIWTAARRLARTGTGFRSADGRVVGWISGNGAYSLPGRHVAWYENGVLYDGSNLASGFCANATGYLPSRPGLRGTPGMPGFAGRPGRPGL